jgi:hypothetical protein
MYGVASVKTVSLFIRYEDLTLRATEPVPRFRSVARIHKMDVGINEILHSL